MAPQLSVHESIYERVRIETKISVLSIVESRFWYQCGYALLCVNGRVGPESVFALEGQIQVLYWLTYILALTRTRSFTLAQHLP